MTNTDTESPLSEMKLREMGIIKEDNHRPLRELALHESVLFHAGSPRNITAAMIVNMAKAFEEYLRGDNA